jgi:hypothetical protein
VSHWFLSEDHDRAASLTKEHESDESNRNILVGVRKLLVFDFVVEPLAESFGHLVFDTIPDQLYDISGPIENGRAMGTHPKVRLHASPQLGRDIIVDIVGDLLPDLQAAYLYHYRWIPHAAISFTCLGRPMITRPSPFHTRICL